MGFGRLHAKNVNEALEVRLRARAERRSAKRARRASARDERSSKTRAERPMGKNSAGELDRTPENDENS
jgi:hypothetical protein